MNRTTSKVWVWFSLVLILGMLLAQPITVSASGSTGREPVLCARGKDVGSQLKDVKIRHEKKDYNGTSTNWQVNNYQFVYVYMTGSIDNRNGEIKEGDFFTVKLDDKLRPNGIVDADFVSALCGKLIATDENGEKHVLAVPDYDAKTKTIKYFFTDYINEIDSANFGLTMAEYPDLKKAPNNGVHTFNNVYAGKTYHVWR